MKIGEGLCCVGPAGRMGICCERSEAISTSARGKVIKKPGAKLSDAWLHGLSTSFKAMVEIATVAFLMFASGFTNAKRSLAMTGVGDGGDCHGRFLMFAGGFINAKRSLEMTNID